MRSSIPRREGALTARTSLALVLAAALAAGCGTSSSTGGETTASASRGEPDLATATDSALAFARCMRREGIPMPDPQPVEGGGGVGFALVDEEMSNIPPTRLAAAQKECEMLLPAFPTPTADDLEKMTEDALAFARCMREHGLEMPDPQVTGEGMMHQALPAGLDVRGPRFRKAADRCAGAGGGFFSARPVGGSER
jgi:hypothetical protein